MSDRKTELNKTPDVTVVGAGFSGLYLIHRLRSMGLSVQVLEAGKDVGGTWYWNRYPGARCDSDSIHYSFSFDKKLEQEWTWSERYSPQLEILSYLQHVSERHDLRRHIAFNSWVKCAIFSDKTNKWTVTTEKGDEVTSRYLVMATGCLSAPNKPTIRGGDRFKGEIYHTGEWPHEPVSFKGKTVGVIGTGSSAMQSIPEIAKQAKHVYVFQRTPNFSVPARNVKLDPQYVAEVKSNYDALRDQARWSAHGVPLRGTGKSVLEFSPEQREQILTEAWERGGAQIVGTFTDVVVNPESNKIVAEFFHDQIRRIVKDQKTAEKLLPRNHPIGTKRICVDSEYYQTFNRPNVTLVDVKEDPIAEITETGLRTGKESFDFDALVYATGFDAMTGALNRIDIRGSRGRSLREKWSEGPRTYMGLASNGFPNMFMVTGPGSPSVLSNMTTSIEQHVELITDYIQSLVGRGIERVEPDVKDEDKWVAHVNEVANTTLLPQANSWYIGANIPGKPRVFLPYIGGVGNYRQLCKDMVAKGYEGFVETGHSLVLSVAE
jgi:cyclohexanone monooxygenase